MNDDIEELLAKIAAMRQLLTDWNPNDYPVWEHPAMQKVGESEEDYEYQEPYDEFAPPFDVDDDDL